MSEFVFVIKLFFITVALMVVMQIRVGERSLESHAIGWVQTSPVIAPLNAAAHGGARMIKDLTAKIHASITNGKNKRDAKQAPPEDKKKSFWPSFRWDSIHNGQEKPGSGAGDDAI